MRRSQLYLLALGLLIALIVSSCAPAAPAAPAPAEGGAAPAAAQPAAAAPAEAATTLVYATDTSDLISLDPAVVYEFTGVLIAENIYDTLVKFEGDNLSELKPSLAEHWEIAADGDMWKITFHLDPDARFASGNPVTAADVVYSFSRVLDLNKSPAFLLADIPQLKKENMTAVDERTVELKIPNTASPQALLSILTFSVGGIVEKAVVEQHVEGDDLGSTWLRDHSAGSAPYVLERWEPEQQVVLTANPNYWGPAPKLSQIIIRHIAESSNQQFALESGDIDVARNLTPEQVEALSNNPDITIYRANTLLLIYVGMNVKQEPLDKPQVREAIRWAIDYKAIVDNLLRGGAKVHQTIIPEGLFGAVDNNPFQKDVEKAKALLAEAGVPDGFSIEMLIPTGPAPGGTDWSNIAAAIQSDLAAVGIQVTIKQTTQAELLNIYRAQSGQLVLILWGPDFPDPDGNVGPFTDYSQRVIAFRNNWDNPELAARARAAALEADPTKRSALYAELIETVLHEGPYAVLYQPGVVFGLRKNVQGLLWNPMGTIEFANVSK